MAISLTVLGTATIELSFAARIAKLCALSPREANVADLIDDLPREKKV